LRDTVTMAIGVRFHYKLSDSLVVRPGVSYARGLDDPMAKSHYDIFQLDIPVQF
jgi:long-subunit fatty acid transport protein